MVNISLVISAAYLPLFVLSTYAILFRDIRKVEHERIISEDYPQKVKALKKGYIPLFKPAVLKKFASEGIYYPIGSIPNKKTYLCNEGYGLIKYKTDRFGLRNNDEKWEYLLNKKNIFVVGDSYVNGACVPDNATLTTKINSFTQLNTINLGSNSNSPYEYQAILKSLIKPIIEESNKDNIVVVVFYLNDNIATDKFSEKLLDSSDEIISINDKGSLEPSISYKNNIEVLIKENYPTSSKEILQILEKNKGYLFTSYLNTWNDSKLFNIFSLKPFRIRINRLKTKLIQKLNKKRLSPSEETIEYLSKICRKKCTPLVVYLPSVSMWSPTEKNYINSLNKISRKNDVDFIDTRNIISGDNIEDYPPKGVHFSFEGYNKIAQYISQYILKNKSKIIK